MSDYLEAGLEQIKRAEEDMRQSEASYLSKKGHADTHLPIRLRRHVDGSFAIGLHGTIWLTASTPDLTQLSACGDMRDCSGPGWSELFVAELPEPDYKVDFVKVWDLHTGELTFEREHRFAGESTPAHRRAASLRCPEDAGRCRHLRTAPSRAGNDMTIPTRTEILTALEHEPFCRWPDHRNCCNVTVEDCTCNAALNLNRLVTNGWIQLEPGPPLYPDTQFLTLCTLPGRRGGVVTIGESRIPTAPVLDTIRTRGVTETAAMWPQLTDQELMVLQQLVTDIDARKGTADHEG